MKYQAFFNSNVSRKIEEFIGQHTRGKKDHAIKVRGWKWMAYTATCGGAQSGKYSKSNCWTSKRQEN